MDAGEPRTTVAAICANGSCGRLSSTTVMSNLHHLTVLALLMATCGLLGGLVNYWGALQVREENEAHPLLKRISAGLAASFVVPLFLNMISSSLVADSREEPLKLLVIAGFCIVAAIFSRTFLESISRRVLNQVEQLDRDQRSLREDVEPVIVKEQEPTTEELSTVSRAHLDPCDKDVLEALANPKWSMRSLNGIMKETGLGESEAKASLARLCDGGLVRKNTKNHKAWWWLTSEGRSLS